MTRKIYDQHDAAFRQVSAYVVLKDGEPVARVALKFPADGAGRLYAYVHWLECEMVRDFAGGYGYDKRTAAFEAAALKIDATGDRHRQMHDDGTLEHLADFKTACQLHSGYDWTRALEQVGFRVVQAV